MPRGGRRPGAGAPKGNFNAVRSGNHSRRMLMVYLAVINNPDPRAVIMALYRAGFFPANRFNGNLRGAVAFLYRLLFDSPCPEQSTAIKDGQTATPDPLPADSDRPETGP